MTDRCRNLGVIFAIMTLFCALYLFATEYISLQKSKGEILVFRKSRLLKAKKSDDEEAQAVEGQYITSMTKAFSLSRLSSTTGLDEKLGKASFLWADLNYEVPIRKGKKEILKGIDGWIRPGTLIALIV